jgi:hypothetical protein
LPGDTVSSQSGEGRREAARLEAFSDGVTAVIITIMAFGLNTRGMEQLAYSYEVSSCGFWPGGSEEGSLYAYAYPTPDGFTDWPVRPVAAYFDEQLGEYTLPYGGVRTSDDPDRSLLEFFQTTYEAAATLPAGTEPHSKSPSRVHTRSGKFPKRMNASRPGKASNGTAFGNRADNR